MAAVIPLHRAEGEPNLAPAIPLRQRADLSPPRSQSIEVYFRSWRDRLKRQDESAWDRRALISQKNELFYRGYQRVQKAMYGNYWRILDEKPVYITLNSFRLWSDLITSKWVASNYDYEVYGQPEGERQIGRASCRERV